MGVLFLYGHWVTGGRAVRTVMIGSEHWFVAADVQAALDRSRRVMEHLDKDEKGVSSVHPWRRAGDDRRQ